MAQNQSLTDKKEGHKLAQTPPVKWETENDVLQAVREGRVAHIDYSSDPLISEDGSLVPVKIDWPEGKKQEDCVLLIGYPMAGLHQTVREVTMADGTTVNVERVGTYAPGVCGAYRVLPEVKK